MTFMRSAEQIVELYTFCGIKRLERYYDKTTYFIISLSIVLCDTFSRDTKDWFYVRSCFGCGEKNRSKVNKPPATACFRLLATNAPENITAARPFWYPYRNAEIHWYHRAHEHQSQRARNSAQNRFAFCRTQ